MKADFWKLKQLGRFANHNASAKWLQAHKGDPYWMAHQLYDFHRGDSFLEAWKMAREIKGHTPLTDLITS